MNNNFTKLKRGLIIGFANSRKMKGAVKFLGTFLCDNIIIWLEIIFYDRKFTMSEVLGLP